MQGDGENNQIRADFRPQKNNRYESLTEHGLISCQVSRIGCVRPRRRMRDAQTDNRFNPLFLVVDFFFYQRWIALEVRVVDGCASRFWANRNPANATSPHRRR
jgi:hypothetical protein